MGSGDKRASPHTGRSCWGGLEPGLVAGWNAACLRFIRWHHHPVGSRTILKADARPDPRTHPNHHANTQDILVGGGGDYTFWRSRRGSTIPFARSEERRVGKEGRSRWS